MNKLMTIYFLGDPNLHYRARLGDLKVYSIAAACALVSMPWTSSQLDGWSRTVTAPTP